MNAKIANPVPTGALTQIWIFQNDESEQYFCQNGKELAVDDLSMAAVMRDYAEASELRDSLIRITGESWSIVPYALPEPEIYNRSAQQMGISLERLDPGMRKEMLDMELAAKAMNSGNSQQLANFSEFALMCFESGLERLGKSWIQPVMAHEHDANWSDIEKYNAEILRAAIAMLRENYARELVRRGVAMIEQIAISGIETPESRAYACAYSGLFPFPRCLALGLASVDQIDAMDRYAATLTERGIQTSAEFVYQMTLVMGLMDLEKKLGKKAMLRWIERAANANNPLPIANFSASIMKVGLKQICDGMNNLM